MNLKLVVCAFYLLLSVNISHAALITTVTENDSFVLMNPRAQLATDFQVNLIPPLGDQKFGGGDGGSAFDRTTVDPCCFVRFEIGSGSAAGTGVAGNDSIILNIMGFATGTQLTADFSYDVPGTSEKEYQAGILVSQGIFDPQFPQGPLGNDLLVKSVPEPASIYLLILGLVGVSLGSRMHRA